MTDIQTLSAKINEFFSERIERSVVERNELTIEVSSAHLLEVALALRDESSFDFKCLMDVCGIDYLLYGLDEWETESATATGFERGVTRFTHHEHQPQENFFKHRFASIYHLLSLKHNQRIRVRVFVDEKNLRIPSVVDIWPAANWFERESFDLFGIVYEGHPDLRRILTDYGFVGHPFRKDFPLSGPVEARYDATEKSVIYEPVSIKPRVLEPKVIRTDPRYEVGGESSWKN